MVQLKTNDIVSTGNVRLEEGDLNSLILSMSSLGLITPITVQPFGDNQYAVVAGHRRLAAAKRLEWTDIEAYVVNGDGQHLAMQVAENVARSDLTPYELAQGVLALKLETGMNQDKIAEAVGLDKNKVSELQRIARGVGTIDPILLNQMDFEELSMFEEVHDLDNQLRPEFEAGYAEAEDRGSGYWYVHEAARQNKRHKWMKKKDNAVLIQSLLDAGAVPMEAEEVHQAKRLHAGEIKAHEGQPDHGFYVASDWQSDDGFTFMYYCLDPNSHAGEKDGPLAVIAKEAERKGISGTTSTRREQKERRDRKQQRKDAVLAFSQAPKMRGLTEAMYITLLNLVKDYKWNELGKTFGLDKPADTFHYDWDQHLDKFAGKDRLTQQLILCVGAVYISLEGNYGRDPEELKDLDRIFGVTTESGDEEE
jgi:ParB/RepB/Spo0J family partition protein